MTPHEAYAILSPYMDNEIDYSNEQKVISTHDDFCKNLEEHISKNFAFSIKVFPPFNYTKSFSIFIEPDTKQLNQKNSPINIKSNDTLSAIIFISAKGPFCTYKEFRRLKSETSTHDTKKWPSAPIDQLQETITPLLNWLLHRYSLTYIPFELLQQKIPNQTTILDDSPATLFTAMFSEA